MVLSRHSVSEGDDEEHHAQAPVVAIDPVVILTIFEEKHHFHHQCGPQQTAEPVDRDQRQRLHEAVVLRQDEHHECYEEHDAYREPVHDMPVLKEVGGHSREPPLQIDVAYDDDVEQREEDLEVTSRCHPQLDV